MFPVFILYAIAKARIFLALYKIFLAERYHVNCFCEENSITKDKPDKMAVGRSMGDHCNNGQQFRLALPVVKNYQLQLKGSYQH